MAKMIPVVVLVDEHDLKKLTRKLTPVVEHINSHAELRAVCLRHGWSADMLAWSTVLRQVAQSVE